MASNNAGNEQGQDEGSTVAASEAPPESSGGIVETIKTVVYAVLIALFVRTVAYEPFNIPSGSMIPTLLVGDYLFVSKFSYGYSRYSIPFNPPLISDRILADPPERGDVAVFKLPSDNSTDYIKRVIGLPGDRIQVERGILSINGKQVSRRRVEDYTLMNRSGVAFPVPRYVETLPNGKSYYVIEADHDNGSLDNTKEFTVPKDHFFMMGDNRDNSLDSRAPAVGFVPFVNYVGRAEVLFFSAKCDPSNVCAARIWEVWKWPFAIRYGRLFNGID
ncbi:MAG: signal peptidase I [Alphaproteobacteria bacterium]|nr:signal peptidase I [Alphaproteobacteria bacterium]